MTIVTRLNHIFRRSGGVGIVITGIVVATCVFVRVRRYIRFGVMALATILRGLEMVRRLPRGDIVLCLVGGVSAVTLVAIIAADVFAVIPCRSDERTACCMAFNTIQACGQVGCDGRLAPDTLGITIVTTSPRAVIGGGGVVVTGVVPVDGVVAVTAIGHG